MPGREFLDLHHVAVRVAAVAGTDAVEQILWGRVEPDAGAQQALVCLIEIVDVDAQVGVAVVAHQTVGIAGAS
jgi:hypothetical protein